MWVEVPIRIIFAIAAFLLLSGMAYPNGEFGHLYVLYSAMKPFDEVILRPDNIDGLALQIGWREVEPTEGNYDWHNIDEVIEAARRHNKQVTIHLMPLFPPSWVFSAGVEAFTFTISNPKNPRYGQQRTEVVPWDPVFLAKWTELTKLLGARYNNNPTVFAISVVAPSPEMVLPGGIPGSDGFQRIQSIYSKDRYLQAWQKMIDVYQEAFPDKPKFIAPGVVLTDESFADEVLQYASRRFGDKLWAFNAGLHAEGTAVATIGHGHIQTLLEEYGKKGRLGFQTIWSATNDPRNRMRGPLKKALENGVKYGASYIEVYEADVRNPSLQEDLSSGSSLLHVGTPERHFPQ